MMATNDIKKNSAIEEIRKKVHLTIYILAFIIVALFAVTIYYNYTPVSSFFSFLPHFSLIFIVVTTCFLGFISLFLAIRIAGQVLRIVQDYNSRTERMFSIAKDLRDEVYGDILLGKIMDYALEITDSESGSILLHDKDKLIFRIVKGEKAGDLIGTSIEAGKGIAGYVAHTGMPLRISDASKDERFNPEIDAITGYDTKAVMCVPLMAKSEIIGVIEVLNRRGGYTYRSRDQEIIEYLAEQAAISLVKTKFYEDQKNYQIHLTDMLIEAIDFHILEKRGHSRRVARYGNIIARGLNMTDEEKRRLYFGSLLHDVGFLKIHTDDSYKKELFIKHPVIGYEMINPITFYADIAPFILYHHERYDGTGYPSGMKGEDIPIEARIISIAEAFDAMTSTTSYKVPMSFEEALEELRDSGGSQFDPELVDLFINNVSIEHTK